MLCFHQSCVPEDASKWSKEERLSASRMKAASEWSKEERLRRGVSRHRLWG